jgi:hypothetical protein
MIPSALRGGFENDSIKDEIMTDPYNIALLDKTLK